MLDLDVERSLGRFHLRARLQAGAGVTALFGRSGAGKSMLTHVIAGLLRPDRGRVSVSGETLYDSERGIDVPAHRRRVGYVFQDGRLLPHLTVRHNLLYGRLFRRGDGGFVDLHQVVDLLGLEYLLERRPAHLSGGEKQRVAIGRALLANPRLLLMDEPLAALDVHRKGEILQYVERLRDEVKIPIVYVSHAIEEVVRLADTVVVLSDGEVKAVGPVDEVMGRLDLRRLPGASRVVRSSRGASLHRTSTTASARCASQVASSSSRISTRWWASRCGCGYAPATWCLRPRHHLG